MKKLLLPLILTTLACGAPNKSSVAVSEPKPPEPSKHCEELENSYEELQGWCNDPNEKMRKWQREYSCRFAKEYETLCLK